MRALHSVLVLPHYLFGFAALVAFWVPALAKKGSPMHKAFGKFFVFSMLASAFSAFSLAAMTLTWPDEIHPDRPAATSRVVALFLTYLGVVSVTVVHNGLAFLKLKRAQEQLWAPWRVGLNVLALAGSIFSIVYGSLGGHVVLVAMSPVGALVARGYAKSIKEITADPRSRIEAHMSAMIIGGICVHTAFVAGGGRRFLPDDVAELGWWMWLVPTAVGVPVMMLLERRFKRARPALAADGS